MPNQVDHTKNIVELKNLSFSYGEHKVLNDISLEIHKGDYLGLVGGNGSGKTTLLKLILGLLPNTKGEIKLFGVKMEDFKDWSKVGYVPQKATNFDTNFPATAMEVVLMGRYGKRGLLKDINDTDRQKAKEALLHVGMWDYKDRLVGDLSGGQQQRVFIARALAGEPEIIFLDEPTIGIEQNVKKEIFSLLRKLNKELGLTIVLVTHDVEDMANEAMHIACLDCTLVFHDSVDEFFKETHIARPH